MAIDFPSSPTLNQTFTSGNVTYVWDGTKWTASVTGGIALDKIEEGNTSAEVIDTGSDGRFVVTTEGTERLRVDASGNVTVDTNTLYVDATNNRLGIGTSSPGAPLHVKVGTDENLWIGSISGITGTYIAPVNDAADANNVMQLGNASVIRFNSGGSESARFDTSGRLLVGTSSATGTFLLQTEGQAGDSTAEGGLVLRRGLVDASIGSGNGLGSINFAGQSGGVGAQIRCVGDAQWGTNDYPGRLVFSTTPDSGSSPVERMRIKSTGLHFFRSDSTSTIIAGTSSGSGATPYTFVGRHSATGIESGTDSFRVSAGGTIYAVNTTVQSIASERRLKENIAPIDPVVAWNTIKNVPYYSYNFIGVDPAQVNYGPMADEVPDEMRIETDQTDDVGIIHSYNNSMLQARLYVALQAALSKIETLEAKVAALESA